MKRSRRLQELEGLVESEPFLAWWRELSTLTGQRRELAEKHEELLSQAMALEFRAELAQKNAIDALYRSGELEDAATSLLAEAGKLENQSFKAVSEFESQRVKVSEIWYRLGPSERALEELRERGRTDTSQQPAIRAAEEAFKQASSQYERESAKKSLIWEEVERIWAQSAEMTLAVAEKRMQAKKVRRESEGLFATAEERKQRARRLQAEARESDTALQALDARIARVRQSAREQFGCAVGDAFLYFREKGSQRIWGVALLDDSTTYNLEVRALNIFGLDRARGVEFLEPSVDTEALDDGEDRVEDYLLRPSRPS